MVEGIPHVGFGHPQVVDARPPEAIRNDPGSNPLPSCFTPLTLPLTHGGHMGTMCQEHAAKISSLLQRVPRWLTPAALFALSFGLHHETLWGGFVWDDRPAVLGNRDVWTDSSWGDMWRHDFWGQQLAHPESHKSFRPLTTLTYRLSSVLAQRISRKQQDEETTTSDRNQLPNEGDANPTKTTGFGENEAGFVTRTGPGHTDAVGFHLFNVVVHAATCSFSVWLFRSLFAGEELPAVAASLLFTVHPVHVEAVAPIVGRADLLCGFLSVMALCFTIVGTGGHGSGSGKNRNQKHDELKPTYVGGGLQNSQEGQSSGRSACRGNSSSCNNESLMNRELSADRNDEEGGVKSASKPEGGVVVTAGHCQLSEGIEVSASKDVWATEGVVLLSTSGSSAEFSATAAGEAPIASTAEAKTSLKAAGVDAGTVADTNNIKPAPAETNDDDREVLTNPGLCRESSIAIANRSAPDLLCSSSVAAVAVACNDGNHNSSRDDATIGDAGRVLTPSATPEDNEVAPDNEGGIVPSEPTTTPTAAALKTTWGRGSCEGYKEKGGSREAIAHGQGLAAEETVSSPPSQLTLDPATVLKVLWAGGTHPTKANAVVVEDKKVTGPGVVRFCAALLFAACATLCKEVGITVFGLMAGGEFVRLFEESDWRRRQPKRLERRRSRVESTDRLCDVLRKQALREYWRCRIMMRAQAPAAARILSATIFAASLLFLHVRLHEGAGVREWGVLENDISILPSRKERVLSYAFTHAVYASKLLWPNKLCYDWGFSCIPHVTSFADSANLASITLYASVLAAAVVSVARCDTAVMWGLALIAVPFLPASNILFPVGVVVAERLLYLPSLGACVLAGCMLRGDSSGQSGTTSPRGNASRHGGKNRVESLARLSWIRGIRGIRGDESLAPFGSDTDGVGSRVSSRPYRSSASPPCSTTRTTGFVGTPETATGNQRDRSSFSERPALPPSSTSPAAARATTCSRSTLLADPKASTEKKDIRPLPWVLAFRSMTLLPARRTAAMFFLLTWAAYFGARTLRRCMDWNSERALFESALEVCPDGIKTLNNLAVGMLNEKEAVKAEELLRRAVKLHPEFGFALFNLGISLMITRDHIGALSFLERSLKLEPWNTKVMVYIGQVYLELTLKSLEPPPREERGEGMDDGLDDTQHRDGSGNDHDDGNISGRNIRSSSPESLLSSAELYTDKALAAGSRLPLARLVKGQALALRGQHQSAAEFFQESIDISLSLLSGTSPTKDMISSNNNNIGAVTESMEVADGVDLASTYNRLGLALRDSGRNMIAAKEAFLAGLLVAPEDLALLVNGGVAHQAAGDIRGAKALFHRALSVQPNSPELLNNLGWLEEQNGDMSKVSFATAAGLYEKALGLLDEGSPALGQVEINLKNVRNRLSRMGIEDQSREFEQARE